MKGLDWSNKRYSNQLSAGQDQIFDVTFDRSQTNDYRNDRIFRSPLMSTVYPLRFIKIPLRPLAYRYWNRENLFHTIAHE